MEDLDRNQECEEEEKGRVKLVAKDGHGEACFRHRVPGPFVQMIDFDGPQSPEEDVLKYLATDQSADQEHVRQYHEAGGRL